MNKNSEKASKEKTPLSGDKLKNKQDLSNKEETAPKKAGETEPELKKKKDEKMIQLETEIDNLKKERLTLLAEIANQQNSFQNQLLESYKYNNQKIIKRVLDFLVDLEERVLNPAYDENLKKEMFRKLHDELKEFGSKKDKANKINELTRLVNELEERLVQEKKDYLEGLEITRDNLWRTLESEGVKEIEIKVGSDRWDSRFHELFKKEESKEPAGTIVKVREKGYLLHDRIIRPAKVIISKNLEK